MTLQQHWNHSVLGFFDEHELAFRTKVDANEIAQLDLSGSYEVGQLKDNVTLDGPLQVARAILRIRPLVQQKALYFRRAAEDELVYGRCHQNALLHHAQFDFQNLLQVLRAQSPEHDRFVDTVHELRAELAPRRVDRRA